MEVMMSVGSSVCVKGESTLSKAWLAFWKNQLKASHRLAQEASVISEKVVMMTNPSITSM